MSPDLLGLAEGSLRILVIVIESTHLAKVWSSGARPPII
jgi:hypothetical protein